jgi:hypothetical protein
VIVPNTVKKIANDTFKGCDNLVLYINKGSYVEEFAKKSGIKYEFIDK